MAPLAGQWETLSEPHKRKWVALAANFPKLPPAEQAKMHGRMAEWIALSPSQRTEARLNFGETQQFSGDEKKAKWEAYQALSAEEMRMLSAASMPPAKSAAPTAKPLPPHRVVETPVRTAADRAALSASMTW